MTALLWVDESLPRAVAVALREAGYDARDVRDLGLRGSSDRALLEKAASENSILVSGDLDFANPLRFPPQTHAGVIVLRFGRGPAREQTARTLVRFLKQTDESTLRGAITILEPGRARRYGRPPLGGEAARR